MMTRGILVVVSLLVPTALLTAQTGPITVRLSPAPNQTIRTHTSLETKMTSQPEQTAPEQAMPSQNIDMTLTTDTTSTIGPTNAQGRYEARVVCDTAESTATIDGKPMTNAPKVEAAGLAFTFVYDNQGKVVDVTAERGPASDVVAAVKQMLTTVMSTPAPLTLAVGETTTVPDPVKAPLSAAVPGAIGEIATTGETRYTLTSITFDGADRIAHLTTATARSATWSLGSSAGPGPDVTFDQRVTGDGTLDVNIDRGIVLHSGQQLIIEGTTHMGGRNGVAARSSRMHGICHDQLGRCEVTDRPPRHGRGDRRSGRALKTDRYSFRRAQASVLRLGVSSSATIWAKLSAESRARAGVVMFRRTVSPSVPPCCTPTR